MDLRQWEPNLNHAKNTHQESYRLMDLLFEVITKMVVPERPGRKEPRAIKRRPKPYAIGSFESCRGAVC